MNFMKRAAIAVVLVSALSLSAVGCGSSSSSSGSFCDNAKSKNFNDLNPADGAKFTDALKSLQKSAPSEIKGDMSTLTNALIKLQSLDTADPKAMAAALKDIDQTKVEAASKNIQKYLKDKCGIKVS